MRSRGRVAVAGLALLAACDRSDSVSQPVASALPRTMAVPVAPTSTPVDTLAPPAEPVVAASVEAHAAVGSLAKYLPRDECAKLPDFSAFREAVFAATAKRDGEALAALADPDIRLDFGGGAGRDELRKRLAEPNSGLWSEIATLASLGCAADGTVATLPAIFSRVPDDVDAGRTMLITGSAVPLRRKPSPGAPMVRTLDWALVTLKGDGFDPASKYAEVTAADGSSGFVATAKLRSLLDYRLIADRTEGGTYRITALIAGD